MVETKSKQLQAVGSEPTVSAEIGGVGNMSSGSSKKPGTDGSASSGGGGSGGGLPIAPYKEGGFRNKAMEHKRG